MLPIWRPPSEAVRARPRLLPTFCFGLLLILILLLVLLFLPPWYSFSFYLITWPTYTSFGSVANPWNHSETHLREGKDRPLYTWREKICIPSQKSCRIFIHLNRIIFDFHNLWKFSKGGIQIGIHSYRWNLFFFILFRVNEFDHRRGTLIVCITK